MLKPDITTLRIFLTTYRVRNISKAAEIEYIAPSAISKRIQALESEIGAVLFYRHARGVTATPAGDELARHVLKLLCDVNQMNADLGHFASGIRGQVRIHANLSSIVEYLPRQIAQFVAKYPEVHIELTEEICSRVVQATVDGMADIGIFAENVVAPDTLTVFRYQYDKLGALVPRGHPLVRRNQISFAEIRNSDFIGLTLGSSIDLLLTEAAQSAGFALKTRIRVVGFEAAVRMVEAGLGVTVVPTGAIRCGVSQKQASYVPLSDKWAERWLLLCVKADQPLTTAASLMLQHLRNGQLNKTLLENGKAFSE